MLRPSGHELARFVRRLLEEVYERNKFKIVPYILDFGIQKTGLDQKLKKIRSLSFMGVSFILVSK